LEYLGAGGLQSAFQPWTPKFPRTEMAKRLRNLSRRWKLEEVPLNISLDPISLITLFLDDAEKDLMYRSGDLTWLCCFGLFANPETAWIEYGGLAPGDGVRYYNPERMLTSTVEVRHVSDYVNRLAEGRQDTSLMVKLVRNRSRFGPMSIEWLAIRPLILLGIIIVAAISWDFLAISAIASILVGQGLVIRRSIADRTEINDDEVTGSMEHNVFFLANNVTVMVESPSRLFVKACSTRDYKKMEKPIMTKVFATLLFMMGVLLIGIAGLNSKIAYLTGHVLQAVFIAVRGRRPVQSQILNSVRWEICEGTQRVHRRRDAYLWACKKTTRGLEWLSTWNLVDFETLDYVKHNMLVAGKKSNVENVDSFSGRQELEQGVGIGTHSKGFANTYTESGKRRLAGGGAMTPWPSRNADETQAHVVTVPA